MTDKITFTIGGERHELPIDGSKTPRVGNVSPDMKLDLTASKMTDDDQDLLKRIIRNPEYSEWVCYLFGCKPGEGGISWRPHKGKEPTWFWRKMQWLILGNLWVKDK